MVESGLGRECRVRTMFAACFERLKRWEVEKGRRVPEVKVKVSNPRIAVAKCCVSKKQKKQYTRSVEEEAGVVCRV